MDLLLANSAPLQFNPTLQICLVCVLSSLPFFSMYDYKNTSPAKKLRGLKRLLTFLRNKSQNNTNNLQNSLSISSQSSFSILPQNPRSNLEITCMPNIDIPPIYKEKSKLNLVKCNSTSIPPRTVYHPIVVNVCQAMFSKHPKNLTPEEVAKFNIYKERKKQIGEPLESEVIYLPTGGIRTCLNCGELT